jgi:transcriptional regulator with XRE-family HTH domain
MSPTYLSKVERGEFPPPGEEKVKSIAQALGQNEDELLALAGRVASDLNKIIRRQPREMADFLRSASGLPAPDLDRLRRDAEKRKRVKERGGI